MHLASTLMVLLLAQNAPLQSDSIPGTLVRFDMVLVPARPGTDERPFWIGKTEVTWDEFDVWAFRLDLPPAERAAGVDANARPSRPYGAPDRGFGHRGFPAIGMTYFAAQEYCAWLSAKTGQRYRLPTDAEWTRAALLGVGIGKDSILNPQRRDSLAWHAGNAGATTHAIATKAGDALGLHDLLGNVAEWVTGTDGTPLVRGGSWTDPPEGVSPSARARQTPAWNQTDPQFPKSRWWLADAPFVGFRIVREP